MTEARRMRPLLGTFVEIGAAGDDERTHCAIDAAFSIIDTTQRLLSFQDPDSELSRMNRRPGEWVTLTPLSRSVLLLARAMTVCSARRFNCTVGGQLVTWGALPNHDGAKRLDVGCAEDIEIQRGAVRLRRPVLVTLDGIAKGYAVDCAIAVLKRRGLPFGWVNAGGDLRVFGERQLSVLRREGNGDLQQLTMLHNRALATSQSAAHNDPDLPGRIVGDVLDDAEGNVSVLAGSAWRADALTKVASLTPANERGAVLVALGGTLVTATTPCSA